MQENTEYVPDFLFAIFHPPLSLPLPNSPRSFSPLPGKKISWWCLATAWTHASLHRPPELRSKIGNSKYSIYCPELHTHIYSHTQLCIIQFRANYKKLQDTARGHIHRRKVRDLWSVISVMTTFSLWFSTRLDQMIMMNKSAVSLVQPLKIQPIGWSRYLVKKETSRLLSENYSCFNKNILHVIKFIMF